MSVAPDNEVAAEVLAPGHAADGTPTVKLGLVLTPVLEAQSVERLDEDVASALAERYPAVNWSVTAARDSLVRPSRAVV